jgi:hypothetical protein
MAMSEHLSARFNLGSLTGQIPLSGGTATGLSGLQNNPGQCLAEANGNIYANPSAVKGERATNGQMVKLSKSLSPQFFHQTLLPVLMEEMLMPMANILCYHPTAIILAA